MPGTPDARRETMGGKVKCPNPNCVAYDREFAQRSNVRADLKPAPPLPTSGDFDPGPNTIEIRYRHLRGDERTCRADRPPGEFCDEMDRFAEWSKRGST